MRYQKPNCNYTRIRKPKEEKNEENSVVFFFRLFSNIAEGISFDFR